MLITLFAYIIKFQTREFTMRKHQYSASVCAKSVCPIVPKLNYMVQNCMPFLMMYRKLGHKLTNVKILFHLKSSSHLEFHFLSRFNLLELPEERASQKIVSLSAAVWWERKRQGSKRGEGWKGREWCKGREGCKGREEICCIFPINFFKQ